MKFDMSSCGGCCTCELACAFHHTGEFGPSRSSLEVIAKEDGSGYQIRLTEASGAQRLACDGCQDLDVPLCLEYCREVDDLGKILQEFEGTRNRPKKTE